MVQFCGLQRFSYLPDVETKNIALCNIPEYETIPSANWIIQYKPVGSEKNRYKRTMRPKVSDAWTAAESLERLSNKSPSPSQVYRELQKFKRPKSVPLRHYNQSTDDSSWGHRSRPRTAFARHAVSDCDRVYQVEHEPTRRHVFESHFPIKKQNDRPLQQQIESTVVTFQETPGYTLTKSKDKISMTINMEPFFNPSPKETKTRKKAANSASESLILQLQQQVNDLQLYLEEERLGNKELLRKAEENLHNKMEDLKILHEDEMRTMIEKYCTEIESIKSDHEKKKAFQHNESEAVISKMRGEIGFLQGAFETYKSNLHQESVHRIKKRENELITKYQTEMESAQSELMTRMMRERTNEKSLIEKDNSKTIENMTKEHKKEIDSLHRRFAVAAGDAAQLMKVSAEFENFKKEYNSMKTQYDSMCSLLTSVTRQLTDTKIRVLEFEQNFNVKVQHVDDKYCKRIESLMKENSELRQIYRKKCGELHDEKQENDKKLFTRMQTAKDTMQFLIETKNRANVSLAAEDPSMSVHDKCLKQRPESAPITRIETKEALKSAGQLNDPWIDPKAKGDYHHL